MLALVGCENINKNSVPVYPVRIIIDTKMGPFVHFQPTAINTYITVDREGYHYNNNVYPLGVEDAYGYGGVVVFINMLGGYDAYDLACPYCALHGKCQPCEIDGFYAICPDCHEQYDLGSGTAVPTQGIGHEFMRRLNLINFDGKLTITQQR